LADCWQPINVETNRPQEIRKNNRFIKTGS
jgi:hypothetical protein